MKEIDLTKHADVLRAREAAFADDVMPAGYQPKAPREFYGDTRPRAVPRMHEQKPWRDERAIDSKRAARVEPRVCPEGLVSRPCVWPDCMCDVGSGP